MVVNAKQNRVARRVGPLEFNTLNGGRYLRELRKQAQITQEELAELSGLSDKEISRIETGHSEKVSFESVIRLALVFDLPVQTIANEFGVSGLRSFTRGVWGLNETEGEK